MCTRYSGTTKSFSKLKKQTFYSFRNCRPGKYILRYSRKKLKNSFLCYKNKKFKKSKNWRFFEGVYSLEKLFLALKYQKNIFLGYKRHFLALQVLKMAILQSNISQEKVFYDILERKNAFLGNKNKKFKKSKN